MAGSLEDLKLANTTLHDEDIDSLKALVESCMSLKTVTSHSYTTRVGTAVVVCSL